MGVAPPPSVGVRRDRSRALGHSLAAGRSRRVARGRLSFSIRRTREFERDPLPLLLRCHERFRPGVSRSAALRADVFALGPEANHYITVSHASNFRWRDGGLGDLIRSSATAC